MKLRMYWSYATRSLARNGQRTLLAIFCVAVGVMAIVALQLVGNMVNNGLTNNVREANGGDISVRSTATDFSADQLTFFDALKQDGTITDYTKASAHQAQTRVNDTPVRFSLRAVDPSAFPLAGHPLFDTPSDGNLASLLVGNNVVVTRDLLDDLQARVGDTVRIASDDGRSAEVTIAGVIQNAGFFRRAQMLLALDAYAGLPSSSGRPITYSAVYANVPDDTDANAAAAERKIQNQMPTAVIRTTKEVLADNEQNVQNIRYFLQVVGLLALLIGGVGIINTMQVLLRRRRTEIAMLKTTGYRQRDLYVMFGLEAGLLGLLGGVVGAAAGTGVSFFVKGLVEKAFFIVLPDTIDPLTVASGVVIGVATALIFGLLPIVQASRVRPIAVLRELPEGASGASLLLSIGLCALLAGLFFLLAFSILQNLFVAGGAVGGAGLFMLLISGFFTLLVLGISRFPVPERLNIWYLLLMTVAIAASVGLMFFSTGFGILFLAVSALALLIGLAPRAWKTNVKMALRNIGRQKARTVTTLVALYIGVFSIGLILVLGQDIKDQINVFLEQSNIANSFIGVFNPQDKAAVDAQLARRGITAKVNAIGQEAPVSINGVPLQQILQGAPLRSGIDTLGRGEAASYLSFLQGFDLASGQAPTDTIVQGTQDVTKGHGLTSADAGTNHVLLPVRASLAPLNLKLGDTITVVDPQTKKTLTMTVVGFFEPSLTSFGGIFVDSAAIEELTGGSPQFIYSLTLDPKTADKTLAQIEDAVPGIQTGTLTEVTAIVNELLNNLIIMLTAVASLAMLAGIIIIANAVALAMLERRREIGILKAVGHTSRSVLGEVLVENGVIGFIGALLAMLLVTLALALLNVLVFHTDFGVPAPIVLGLVGATALICMVVAAFVAWNATRVRPLEVLRYE